VHSEVAAHLEVGQVLDHQDRDPAAGGMSASNVENQATLQTIAQELSLVVVGGDEDEDEAYRVGPVEGEEGARQRVVARRRGTLQQQMIISLY
jgi:hypothetical protein